MLKITEDMYDIILESDSQPCELPSKLVRRFHGVYCTALYTHLLFVLLLGFSILFLFSESLQLILL